MAINYATRKQYADMQRICGISSQIFVSNKMATRIMHRLCKHYNMRDIQVVFRGHRDSGCSYCGKIRLSHKPSIYLIMHEFAHEAQNSAFFSNILSKIKNTGTEHHGLHYEIVLNNVNQFCKKSNYFEKMRNRTRKTNKPEVVTQVPQQVVEKSVNEIIDVIEK